MYEVFNGLSPEEQQIEVDRVEHNRGLEPVTYSIEKRKTELEHHSQGPSLREIRLQTLKDELLRLKDPIQNSNTLL